MSSIATTGPIAVSPRRPSRMTAAVLNWATTAAYTIVTVLISIISTPLLLKYLGPERLGANRVISEWFGYLLLAEMGLGPALSVLLFRAQVGGDRLQVVATVRMALRLYARLTALVFPMGLALAWLLPYLVPVQASMVAELRWSAMIAAAGFLLYPFGVFRTMLETQQRTYVAVAALTVQSVATTATALLLARMGFGLLSQSIAMLLGMIVYNVIISLIVKPELPQLWERPAASHRYRDLWYLAWPFAVTDLATRLNLMTDNIVVGFVLGPTQVAAFFLTQRLPGLVGAQITGVVNATWAGLAELNAKGDKGGYESRIVELARLVISVGIPVTGTVAAYNFRFVQLWVGQAQYGGDLLSILTALSGVISSFLLLFTRIVDIQGDARLRFKMCLAGALLNIVLSVWLAHTRLGMAGVILGTVIASLVTEAWYVPYLACNKYGIRWSKLLAGCGSGAALGLPWAVAIWFFARAHAPLWSGHSSRVIHWLGLLVECGAAEMVALLYCWCLALSSRERTLWSARVRRINPASVPHFAPSE